MVHYFLILYPLLLQGVSDGVHFLNSNTGNGATLKQHKRSRSFLWMSDCCSCHSSYGAVVLTTNCSAGMGDVQHICCYPFLGGFAATSVTGILGNFSHICLLPLLRHVVGEQCYTNYTRSLDTVVCHHLEQKAQTCVTCKGTGEQVLHPCLLQSWDAEQGGTVITCVHTSLKGLILNLYNQILE